MKRKSYRGFGGEEGQSIVEAAIIIPLFIMILCGIIDFGWIMSKQLTVNNCSREGARYAAVYSQETNLTQLVTARVLNAAGGDTQNVTVTVTFVDTNDVRVVVTKTVKVLTPMAGIFVQDQQITLQSSTIMRIG